MTRSVSPELLTAWRAFYATEDGWWREPFTAGNEYDDMMDERTLAGLERVRDSLLRELANANTLAEGGG